MPMMLASDFSGLATALLAVPMLLIMLAAASLGPSIRGSSWIWPLLLLIGESLLILQLVWYCSSMLLSQLGRLPPSAATDHHAPHDGQLGSAEREGAALVAGGAGNLAPGRFLGSAKN